MQTCNVLLIQDDLATGRVLVELLTRSDVSVNWISTADAAEESLCSLPDVVLVDLAESPQGSIQVLARIRSVGMQSKVGIVLSNNDPDTFRQLASLRPDGVFTRPLDFSELVDWLCKSFPEPARC